MKAKILLIAAFCGCVFVTMPGHAHAVITTTTTTDHSYDFPNSEPSVSSSSSMTNDCPPTYMNGGGGGNDESSFEGYDRWGNETTYDNHSDAIASGGTGNMVDRGPEHKR